MTMDPVYVYIILKQMALS